MKIKITFLAMLIFAGILSSQAQQQGPGQRRTAEERTKSLVERLRDSLALSKAQQSDIDSVYLQFYKGQDKLREGLEPGVRPEKADMDKLSDVRDAKLKIILKEEQFTKLKAMEAALRNRGGQRPGGQ